jgi:CRP-like cAMP-binding protein
MNTTSLTAQIARELRQHAPFDAMTEADLLWMVQRLKVAYFEEGTLLISPQDNGEPDLQIIKKGIVRSEDANSNTPYLELHEGEMFPIGALLSRRPVISNYRAGADTFVYQLSSSDFQQLLERSEAFRAFGTRRLAHLLELSRQRIQSALSTRSNQQHTDTPLGTGPLEAYGKQTSHRLHDGPGLRHRRHHDRGRARRWWSSRRTTRASPTWARACWPPPTATTRSTSPWAPPSSGVALAMLPVAEEYKKILLVEPAVADSITGDKWNRTSSAPAATAARTRSNAVALDKAGVTIATLAQDYAFGRDGVKAFKDSPWRASRRPRWCTRNTCRRPPPTSPPAQRIFDALKDKPGRKVIFIIWAGAATPPFKIADLEPKRYGIELATGGNILPAMGLQELPRHGRRAYYYFGIPEEPGERVAGGRTTTSSSRRRRTSSPPAA